MAETTATPAKPKAPRKSRAPKVEATGAAANGLAPAPTAESAVSGAKAKFSKALEDAKASAQSLGKQAQDTADAYREKITGRSDALVGDAKAMAGQARDKAGELATEGKARAVEGISAVSRLVAENAPSIDEKFGAKYGDYARSAAKSMEDAAARLEAKDLAELGEDAREMVRKSPALAIGVAAATGFVLARLFKGSDKSEG